MRSEEGLASSLVTDEHDHARAIDIGAHHIECKDSIGADGDVA